MPDWNDLSDAYGPATKVPRLLAALSPDADDEAWDELWSRLCHQGTVYPASFAALPALEAAARSWPADRRSMPLTLAGCIVASDDVVGMREQFVRGLEPTVEALRRLALESLACPGYDRTEFIYLVQAALALRGDRLWGRRLDGLADGEFRGACPGCGADLYLVIGEYGFFATADEWVKHSETPRTPIEPGRGELPATGRWLREQALAAGQVEVADWIGYVFGTSRCPRCRQPFSIVDAVARTS